MSLTRLQAILIGGWLLAVAAVLGVPFVLGAPLSTMISLAIAFVGCLPVLILLRVLRGAPPQSIAQVLYDAEQTSGERARGGSTTNVRGGIRS